MTAYVCIGIPSPFTHWVDQLIAELVNPGAAAEIASANSLDEFGLVMLRAQVSHVVIQVRQMTPPLRAALKTTGKRFVVVLDHPIDAFRTLRNTGAFDLVRVTRAIAWGCASTLEMAALPIALKIHSTFNSVDLLTTAMSIAQYLGLDVDAETAANIVARLPAPDITPVGEALNDRLSEFDPDERAIIIGAVGGYVHWFAGKGFGQLNWARELFISGDSRDNSVPDVVELTGPVRHLLYGPYIALPPGSWTASISMAFSKEAAGLPYSIEIIAGHSSKLAEMSLYPERAGTFEASTLFSINDQTEQPISLRVTNDRSAIEGKLSLVQVSMTPVRIEKAELPQRISAALDL